MPEFKFFIGQVIHHKLFDSRGVIDDVNNKFLGNDEWYTKVTRSRLPKDQPRHHVLVNSRGD